MPRRKGFTLVELLVVIGIIAVIMAMLMPSLSRARVQARLAQCMSGARQAYFAVEMYCNDNRNYYPAAFPGWHANNPASVNNHWLPYPIPIWHKHLADLKYLNPLLQTSRGGCPHGPDDFRPGDAPIGDYYTPPSDPGVSYGLNGYLQSGYGYRGAPPAGASWWDYHSVWKRTSGPIRKRATHIGVIFCSHVPWTYGTQHLYPAMYVLVGEPIVYQPQITRAGRHNGLGLPVACADGHVEMIRRAEIVTSAQTNQPYGTTIYHHSTWTLMTEIP